MLTEVQKSMLTCLLGPEDTTAFKREQKQARARDRYWADPEKVREQGRARYAADPEKARAQSQAYRARDPEKVREQGRARRASFDLRESAQQRACFQYTNQQPLTVEENGKKGAIWR